MPAVGQGAVKVIYTVLTFFSIHSNLDVVDDGHVVDGDDDRRVVLFTSGRLDRFFRRSARLFGVVRRFNDDDLGAGFLGLRRFSRFRRFIWRRLRRRRRRLDVNFGVVVGAGDGRRLCRPRSDRRRRHLRRRCFRPHHATDDAG